MSAYRSWHGEKYTEMEKGKKGNLFPPLVKPEAKKRHKNNWKLSAEAQKVMNELEKRSRYYREMQSKICGGLFESGFLTTQESRNEEFCIACDQRASFKPAKRRCIDELEDGTDNRDSLPHCVCILCSRVLAPTPHGLRKHHHMNNNIKMLPSSKKEVVSLGGQTLGRKDNYYEWYTSHRKELLRDFHISSLDYDSRLLSPQGRPVIEHELPPRDVMLRSERKCQGWLMKYQDFFKGR